MTKLTDAAGLMAHYTRADTAFECILPSGKLRMNPYSRMRDPFEIKRPTVLSAGSIGSDHDTDSRVFWGVQSLVSKSRDQYCLLSLTQGVEGGSGREGMLLCPWARARMWEQYGQDHAGVCLVFERDKLVEEVGNNLVREGSYWCDSVEYTLAGFGTANGAAISLNDFHDDDSLADDVAIHVQRHYKDFFFLKTLDWATEYEYRFVWNPAADELPEPPIHHVSYGDALRWVVVGEKFPDWQLPAAEEVAERAGAELRRMTWELNFPYPGKATPRR